MLNNYLEIGSCAACHTGIEHGSIITELCSQPTYSSSTYIFLSLIDLIIRSQCSISDPCNRVKAPMSERYFETPNEYDFIVVGGGSAGKFSS